MARASSSNTYTYEEAPASPFAHERPPSPTILVLSHGLLALALVPVVHFTVVRRQRRRRRCAKTSKLGRSLLAAPLLAPWEAEVCDDCGARMSQPGARQVWMKLWQCCRSPCALLGRERELVISVAALSVATTSAVLLLLLPVVREQQVIGSFIYVALGAVDALALGCPAPFKASRTKGPPPAAGAGAGASALPAGVNRAGVGDASRSGGSQSGGTEASNRPPSHGSGAVRRCVCAGFWRAGALAAAAGRC